MRNKLKTVAIKTGLERIDWKLLVFLLLFLNFKLVIKVVAIAFIYLARPGFRFGFSIRNSRLPLFYVAVILIGVLNCLLMGLYGNTNYLLALAMGIFFWCLCVLAVHQVKLAVDKNEPAVLHRTLLIFFIINAIVSLSVYAGIVWETGAINPYRYQGNYQKYFIGTGDYIKGLSFDTSTTNAVISALGVIYFLWHKNYLMVLLCMLVLLLTGSNLSNLLLCGCLLYTFFVQSNPDQKSIIIVCLMMLVIFLVKVSPQNNQYITTAWQKIFHIPKHNDKTGQPVVPITERPDSVLMPEERKQKFAQLYLDSINISLAKKHDQKPLLAGITNNDVMARPLIPGDSIHTPKFQHRNDTNKVEEKLIQFIKKNTTELQLSSGTASKTVLPGKIQALQQTCRFFKQHPLKLVTGTGMGNFSSKLAFRTTAMNLTGNYPARYAWINEDFKQNHLDIYLYYFTSKDDYHSVMNSPNSVYDQLLSEYGLAGMLSFVVFYIGFFVKQVKRQSAAIPILLFMLGAFALEYWFEQLSVLVLFELLLFLIFKETTPYKNDAAC